MFQKRTVKGADGRKSGRVRHLGDVRVFCQQLAGMLYPETVDEIFVAHVHPFPKDMGDIVFVQVEFPGQQLQRKGLQIVFCAVDQQSLNTVLIGGRVGQGHPRQDLTQQGQESSLGTDEAEVIIDIQPLVYFDQLLSHILRKLIPMKDR